MIWKTLLLALTLISLCQSFPTSLDANHTEEVIFVPYDVKFVPVELDGGKQEQQLLKKTLTPKQEELNTTQRNPDTLPGKFAQTVPPEDYILVPMSVFKALEDHAIETGTLKHHFISKRQAPANGFNLYRPVVQFRSITRDKRRVFRPPALVGYLNKYDRFPTVA